MTALLTDNLPLLAGAPNGIKKLRELILELAVRGMLVPQDSNDGQASDWLERIEIEKARLHEAGLLKKTKKTTDIELDFGVSNVPSSWRWVTLSDITLGMDSGWSPACEPNPSPNNDIWGVLKTTAVQVMQFLQEENKELPAHLEPRPDAEVKAGDILFTRAGPTNRVGISCLVESTRPRLMISDKIIRFHPIEAGTYGRYIALCLNAGSTAGYLEVAKSGMAASQVNISQEKLKLAPVPFAPLPEQHRIVAKVDELMTLCDRLEAQQADAESAHAQLVQALLDSLTQASDATDFAANWQRLAEHFHTLFTTEPSIDALKQTLLQLAVMGKLVPQDPSDEPASELLKRVDLQNQLAATSCKSKKPKQEIEAASNIALFELPMGWAIARVAQTGEIKLGRQRSPKDHFGEHMVPYLRVANVKENALDLSDVKEMNFTPAEQETFRLLPGDVLLNEGQSKELVGRPAIFNGEIPGVCFQNTLLRFRAYDCVIPIYALRYFQSCMHSGRFQQAAQQTTNIAHLSASRLAAIEFPLPPVPEQHRIVAKVDQLMAHCDQLKTRLTQASQLNEQLASTLVEQAVA